nr:leucine-rich repeat protein [Tanacetum cinerariifolium]
MPSKQYPPYVLESLAAIAENISQLVDTMTINNEKLAASQVAIKNLIATQNACLSAIITNTAKPENTMVKYFPNSTTYAMPLTYKPPAFEEASTNLVDTRAKCLPEPTSYTIKPEIISKDVVTQNNSPIIDVTTTITKTDTEVATYTPPPSPLPPIIQRDMTTFYFTTRQQTYGVFTLDDKLKDKQVRFWPTLFIPLCFRCVKTYHPGHRCHPPKLVFLQTEPNPPWTPRYIGYKIMSLEDKARFQAQSIDTCLKLKTKSKEEQLMIPEKIGDLKELESLDLSMNKLSGELPMSLSSLHSLSSFNVSYNNLTGRTPSSTQLQSLNDSCFVGNKLCGDPLISELCSRVKTPDTDREEDDGSHGVEWGLIISVLSGFIVGFWVILAPLIVSRSWRIGLHIFVP